MRVLRTRMAVRAGIVALLVSLGGAGLCSAQTTIGFESPTYSVGNLLGQDGWAKNNYYGATLNGNVLVSNSSPLIGSQSLRYEQTVAGGLSDIHKPNVVLVSPGIPGTDLTFSYTIKASSNSFGTPFGGLFLQPVGGSGGSPILAYINGGTITVNAGTVPGDQFFFLEDERLKMTYEIDFENSVMDFTVENLDFAATYTASYPFLAPYGPTGPQGEYVVNVAAFLRGGNVQIDDIVLEVSEAPVSTEYEWTAAGSGNWNLATNWTPAGIPGTTVGIQSVTLGSAISATQTIYNNATRNLNGLDINNSNSYVVAGTGLLQFEANTSGTNPVAPTINVATGAHQIQLAVELLDDTSVTVAGGASLDFNNQIDLNGNTLTTSGTVRINHSTIGRGTVNSTGALVASGVSNIGGDLVSTGALVVGVDADGADAFAVAGDATLSGILDVEWDLATIPTMPMTIVAAGGSLDASGLALAAEDAALFALAAEGSNLTLTFLGVAVPEPASAAMLAIGVGLVAMRRRRLVRPITLAIAALLAIGATRSASAINFTFENPPYTPGTLIGQDNWNTNGYVLADPFFGGVVNGTVEISSSSPLNGSQSVLYTQTVDPATAGVSGASDVGRPNSVFATKDGTDAVDITASVRVRTDENGVGTGSMGFFLGRGGASPIFFRIDNASTTGATGSILVGDGAAVPNVGSYLPNKTYEFTIGVDVDNLNYTLSSKNLTDNTPLQNYAGGGPNGRFVYFTGLPTPAWADDGDGQTFTFDSSLILRSGIGRADDLTLVGDDHTQSQWGGGSGSWSNGNAWIPRIAPNAPTGNAPLAVFGSRITAPETVFANTAQSVNGLRFDNANKYAVAGGGSVVLKANTIGGTVNPTINVLQGAHELQVPVSILNNTTITVAASAALDFNNNIALGGQTLTTSGAVDINVGVTGGGSISNSGTLGTAGATPIAANLASTGTIQIDLGAANVDRFNITGTATLSGLLDVVLEPGFTPAGSYTVLTSTGALNAAGLALHSSDTSSFTLGVSGNSLVLTVGGGPAIPGDFNNNGVVNGADLTKWKGDFGANPNSNADGDADSDGNDFLIWQRNVQNVPAEVATAAVPEPSAVLLAALAAVGCAAACPRRRVA